MVAAEIVLPDRELGSIGRVIRGLNQEATMGRGILLWLLGVPIPVIIIILLVFHH